MAMGDVQHFGMIFGMSFHDFPLFFHAFPWFFHAFLWFYHDFLWFSHDFPRLLMTKTIAMCNQWIFEPRASAVSGGRNSSRFKK